MELVIPNFEQTGVIKSHVNLKVTCVIPGTAASVGLRGFHLLVGLAIRNTSVITYGMFGRSKGQSTAHPSLVQTNPSLSHLPSSVFVLQRPEMLPRTK